MPVALSEAPLKIVSALLSPGTAAPLPRWSQCAVYTKNSSGRLLPGSTPTTLYVVRRWTSLRTPTLAVMPSGRARNFAVDGRLLQRRVVLAGERQHALRGFLRHPAFERESLSTA